MITRKKLLKNETFWTEIIQNQIYSDLVNYINKNNISQTALAEKLGVSKGYISQVLNGKNLNFRINTLVKICIAIEKVPNIKFENIEEFIARDEETVDGETNCEIYSNVNTSIWFQTKKWQKNVQLAQLAQYLGQEDISLVGKSSLRILKEAI